MDLDIDQFLAQTLEEFSALSFVEGVDQQSEVFIVKGRVLLERGYFLQVYFNADTGTIAFSLIKEEKRLWGIDFDSIRGWHLHPLENPDSHLLTKPKSIKEIISELSGTWVKLEDSQNHP